MQQDNDPENSSRAWFEQALERITRKADEADLARRGVGYIQIGLLMWIVDVLTTPDDPSWYMVTISVLWMIVAIAFMFLGASRLAK